MVFSTAPIMGTPKCASSIAGTLGRIADTVSPGPRVELAIDDAPVAVDHRHPLRMDRGGARQESQRGQRCPVRGGATEAHLEDAAVRARHAVLPPVPGPYRDARRRASG